MLPVFLFKAIFEGLFPQEPNGSEPSPVSASQSTTLYPHFQGRPRLFRVNNGDVSSDQPQGCGDSARFGRGISKKRGDCRQDGL